MKNLFLAMMVMALTSAGWAAALGTSTRSAIPGDAQQIISVDYRALRNNATAQALKNQVLPENLKAFETSLRGVGINPEKELEQLTFVSYRTPKQGLKVVGFAQGQFTQQLVLRKLRLRKVKPAAYSSAAIYPMGDGMQMTFLDSSRCCSATVARCAGRWMRATALCPTWTAIPICRTCLARWSRNRCGVCSTP